MLTIFQRERAVRGLPLTGGLGLLLSLLMLPVLGVFAKTSMIGAETSTVQGAASWGVDASFLATLLIVLTLQAVFITVRQMQIQVRVHEFERVLPITMRRIVFERMAATWVVFAVPVLVATLVWATQARGGDFRVLLAAAGRALVTISLGVSLVYSYRARAMRLSILEVSGTAIAAIAVALAVTRVGAPWVQWSALAVTLALLGYLWRTLPIAAPADDPSTTTPVTGTGSAPLGVRLFGPLRWTLIRSTLLRSQVIIPLLLGGLFIAIAGSENAFIAVWLPALLVNGGIRMGMNLLHATEGWPIRRTQLLPFLALPSLIVLILGFSSWSYSAPEEVSIDAHSRVVAIDGNSEDTLVGEGEYEDHVHVPPHLWRIATSVEAARVTAPWGETTDPTPHPVFYGVDTFAYSPYDVKPDNSGRFLMWQIQRALAEVHGYEGSPEDVHATWFGGLDLDGPIADARLRQVDSTDWGFAVPEGRGVPNAAGFFALCATLLWLLVAVYSLRPNVPPRNHERLLRVLGSPYLLGAVAVFLLIFLMEIGSRDRSLYPVLATRLHAALDGALQSSPYLWAALLVAVIGLGFTFLARRLRRIEVPPLVINGWTKKAMTIY